MNICESCLHEYACQIVPFYVKDVNGKCQGFADKDILKPPADVLQEKREKALDALNGNKFESKLNSVLGKLNGAE